MARTLRDLLIQRAARLQERPALTTPAWGTLSYAQLRNRAEGVAFGLLAEIPIPPVVRSATGSPWDWAAELAAAASGLVWAPEGWPLPEALLGGPRFHLEAGRGLYHDREQILSEDTPFHRGLAHGEVLRRLARLNHRLGWDHETEVRLPAGPSGDPVLRAALWSALFGGSHVLLGIPGPAPSLLARFRGAETPVWDPVPFSGFWD